MEHDMTDEPRKPRPQRKKRSAPDRLVAGITKNKVELDEEELKKIGGGDAGILGCRGTGWVGIKIT